MILLYKTMTRHNNYSQSIKIQNLHVFSVFGRRLTDLHFLSSYYTNKESFSANSQASRTQIQTSFPFLLLNMDLLVERHRPIVATAYAAEILACACMLFGPSWTQTIAISVLLAALYATIGLYFASRIYLNDDAASHNVLGENIPIRLGRSCGPLLHALVWGPVASWHIGAFFGLCLTTFPGM